MTFKRVFPFAFERVVTAFRRQGLFVDDYVYDFDEFIEIHTPLIHQPVLFSKNLCVNWLKHRLIVVVRVIPFKVFNHLCKGMKPLGRNLPPEHGVPFPNRGDSFGVKKLLSGYGVAVRGADGTYAVRKKPFFVSGGGLRRESKNNRPRRNFAGNINSQPVAGGYFYGLCNAHGVNIS
jgi:hypothetical protein